MGLIENHGGTWDWCHVCGNRSYDNADVSYPQNAEYERTPLNSYVRICFECAMAIADAAMTIGKPFEERTNSKHRKPKPEKAVERALQSARTHLEVMQRRVALLENPTEDVLRAYGAEPKPKW